MSYRSELETLRRENSQLSRRLEAIEADVASRASHDAGTARGIWHRIVGGRTALEREASVATELTDVKLAVAALRIESELGVTGTLRSLGGRAQWSSPRTFEQTRDLIVSFSEEDGRTRVHVTERLARFGVGAYGLFWAWAVPFVSVFVGLVVERLTATSVHDAPSAFDLGVAAGLVVMSALASRLVFQLWTRARARRLTNLLRGVTDELARSHAPRRVSPPVRAEEFESDAIDARALTEATLVEDALSAEASLAVRRR